MKNIKSIIFLMLILVMGLTACKSTPTEDPAIVITNVARTVQSDLTKTAEAIPTNTPTLEPTATLTPEPETPTAEASPTSSEPTATTAPVTGKDSGVWVSSDPPDGTLIDGGTTFKVTLKLMNDGETTWTTNYYIKFVRGERMGTPEKILLPYPVEPTKQVVLEIEFKGPSEAGTYRGDWNIVNANDIPFYSFYFEYKFD